MGTLTAGRGAAQSNTLEITSDGGGIAVYEFTVSGSVSETSSSREDTVSGNAGYGHVGPDRGTDAFTYSGSITGLAVAGPATVTNNGSAIDPRTYPQPRGSITSESFPSASGTNTIRIESDGGGLAAYEFAVSSRVEKGPEGREDTVRGSRVYGHVGPKRGVDDFTYTGDVTSFVLAGPATVYHNGRPVDAADDGTNGTPTAVFDVSVDPLAVGDRDAFVAISAERVVEPEATDESVAVYVKTTGDAEISRLEEQDQLSDTAVEIILEGTPIDEALTVLEGFQTILRKHRETPQWISIEPQLMRDSIDLLIQLSAESPVSQWSDRVTIYQGLKADSRSSVQPIDGTTEEIPFPQLC